MGGGRGGGRGEQGQGGESERGQTTQHQILDHTAGCSAPYPAPDMVPKAKPPVQATQFTAKTIPPPSTGSSRSGGHANREAAGPGPVNRDGRRGRGFGRCG
ncbi:hypothetical protein GCM10010446_04560 [Streptomyces enissocaesilis]|uniref:Uncharacterized protein n=1 Tax=Streptomyces enissocaesilis TaxID=332589 RepID=A0ABN3WS48_9ACTN